VNLERLFLDHLAEIERVVRFVARRHHLSKDESDDLASAVSLKVIENDYEVLRNFRARSSLRTYLTTVATHHFLDQRVAQWGKWRPSVEARRLGPTAVLLDRLLSRDGVPLHQAIEILRSNYGITASKAELLAIGARLRVRCRRRFSGAQELDLFPSATPATGLDDLADAAVEASRIEQALADALDRLAPEDRLILKLRFQDSLPVSRIARALGIEQKPLYRRLDHVMRLLRASLEARGVSRDRVAAIVGHPAADLSRAIDPPAGNLTQRPSI
jgi:RNA polymerase sigma factor for flagellar operon FliA